MNILSVIPASGVKTRTAFSPSYLANTVPRPVVLPTDSTGYSEKYKESPSWSFKNIYWKADTVLPYPTTIVHWFTD